MPHGDRTGPAGYGPMTGRGVGYCAGYPAPGYAQGWGRSHGWRRGWGGRGWGQGFGWRHGWAGHWGPVGFDPTPGLHRGFPSSAETRSDLEAYRAELKKELEGVEEALADTKQKN